MASTQDACRVAAIQMVSSADLQANLQTASELLKEAAGRGATLAVLPENFGYFGQQGLGEIGAAERSETGPLRSFLATQARKLGLWIVGGTIPIAGEGKLSASCMVVDSGGREVARYDKMHLFDVEVEDAHRQYRESADFVHGSGPALAATPAGPTGLAVCYDLRFPELFRFLALRGCSVFAVPAAFTETTGAAHWSLLMRARAVENLGWMIGAGQGGEHSDRRRTWGHSMIVDPWGEIVVQAGLGEAVITAEIDPRRVAELRARMPVLEHTRFRTLVGSAEQSGIEST